MSEQQTVKRFDCGNGGAQWCQGCYQMQEDEYGDYVSFDDYSLLQQQATSDAERIKKLEGHLQMLQSGTDLPFPAVTDRHLIETVREQSERITAQAAELSALRKVATTLEAENAQLREAARWIPVSERLPEMDTPVLVQYAEWPDRITCAMRYEDEDGWLWGQLTGYNATLNRQDSYEFDDDYLYRAWMPLPTPPSQPQGSADNA